jgi:hypothetical protein
VNVVADADITAEDAVGWGWLAQTAASTLWDNDAWRALLVRHVRLARAAGALGQLPVMLDSLGTATAASGDFAAAEALIAEAGTIRQVTGVRATPLTAVLLASLRGCHGEAAPLIQAAIAAAEAGRHGLAIAYAYWAAAILHNGAGRYEQALTAARHACQDTTALPISMWALPELVEAAARAGHAGSPATRSPSCRNHPAVRHRYRAPHRGALPGPAQSRRRRRRPVPRGDRPAGPDRAASRTRPRLPAARGMAAPPGPAPRCARSAAHRPRHSHRDRHGGICRARAPGADRHR